MTDPSARRRRSALLVLLPALALLGIQLLPAFRAKGFSQPDGGLLGLLEAPAALLGWGGVIFLAVPVLWLFAGWRGRDLFGLEGLWGLAVRLVGCIVLGVAVGGLLGLAAGTEEGARRLGGDAGAGLVGLFQESGLGPVVGGLVLALLAIPSAILAVSPFFPTGSRAVAEGRPTKDALASLTPPPGLFEGTAPPTPGAYPQRRYDETGAEIPMTFDGRDVGPIRFADQEEAAAATPAPEPVEAAPADAPLPTGVRYADEPEPEGRAAAEPVEVDDRLVPLPPGVRFADAEAEEDSTTDLREEEEPEEQEIEEVVEEAPRPAPAPPLRERVVPPGPPAVVPTPMPAHEVPPPEEAVGDAVGEFGDERSGERYRAKLAGSGIFDEPGPPPARASAARPQAKRKPAAKKKKAKAAGRTAPAKKKPDAKKKAKAAGKKARAKKKPAPRKKPAPKKKRKAPAKKAAARKPSARKAAPRGTKASAEEAAAPARKGARIAGPGDELYERAVEVAMERGAASSVLLSRRLGIGYAQARSLMDALVEDEVLGEMTPSGSRPLLITEREWKKRKR